MTLSGTSTAVTVLN